MEGASCDLFGLPALEDGLIVARLGSGTHKRRTRFSPDDDAHDFTDPSTGEIFNLREWARDYGGRFEIADALLARQPGVPTGHVADGIKMHIKCPNEDDHTQAGEDAATFVTNAGNATKSRLCGALPPCHCTGMDRLIFVQKMLERQWLSVADLTNNTFLVREGDKNEHPDADNVEDVEYTKAPMRMVQSCLNRSSSTPTASGTACPRRRQDQAADLDMRAISGDRRNSG